MSSPAVRFLHPSLEIPPSVLSELLPDPSIPILQFLEFPLPVISPASNTHPSASFFGSAEPDVTDAQTIRRIPVPAPEIVARLGHACKDAVLSLWVLPYWTEVVHLRSSSRERWVRAEKALGKRSQIWDGRSKVFDPSHTHTNPVEEVCDVLASLPWGGTIQGFDNEEPIDCLATYATHDWLSDVHEDQMLDILRRTLLRHGVRTVEIENISFMERLKDGYSRQHEYEHSNHFRRARKVGEALSSGARTALGLEINVGGNHWVAAVLDERVFMHDVLAITIQIDGFSCGLFGPNALGHYFLPKIYPLISNNEVDNERLKIFLAVVRRHLDEDFSTVSREFKFTFTRLTSGLFTEPTASARSASPGFEEVDKLSMSYKYNFDEDTSDVELELPDSPTPASSTLPSTQGSTLKLLVDIQHPSGPPLIKKKKINRLEVQSAIRSALESAEEGQAHGLMKFLKRCSPEEYQEQVRRESGRDTDFWREHGERQEIAKEIRLEKDRDDARTRKQKSRRKMKVKEIAEGERSPGGTKRKKPIMVQLEDGPSKKTKHSVAELSRPNRARDEHKRLENKKPQGRKRVHVPRDAVYHNWHDPFIWRQILQAAKNPSVGWKMSPTKIMNILKQKDPETFAGLARSTIDGWIDRTGSRPKWSDSALRLADNGHHQGHPNGGRRGVLTAYPEVVTAIVTRLEKLRDAAAPLTLITIRGVVVATILRIAPEIFEKTAKDGSRFRCSDSFLREWLHGTLCWSLRRSTRAGHKLPLNWEDLCEKALFRIAYSIKEHDIPSSLFVNTDQTQVIYAQGASLTWAKTGSKQVSTVGEDEKRAFTAVVSVSNNGTLLPFQAIYQGYSKRSLPSASVPNHASCTAAGFVFEFSESATYWSTQKTMRSLVDQIIAPYFDNEKKILGLPLTQKAIWQIDVWSVHRSKEFREWMKTAHPSIILDFVPGGCTGVFQPCDVGMQRIFKHSIKRSYHGDVVNSILKQIDTGVEHIQVDKTLGFLRDKSVTWLWNAHQAVGEERIVKKAFEMCRTGEFNLSYDSLTGFAAREKLRNFKITNTEFWAELTQTVSESPKFEDTESAQFVEDDMEAATCLAEDDSNLPCDAIASCLVDASLGHPAVITTSEGDLVSAGESETLVDPSSTDAQVVSESVDPQELGVGKRKRIPNKFYDSKTFWKH